jgi:hypothetical protein
LTLLAERTGLVVCCGAQDESALGVGRCVCGGEAGVNAKALSTYMGHSSIAITIDRYGHLMPGNENEAATLFDRYLTGAQTGAQAAQTQ